jgi:hypothetical protein
LIDSAEDEAGVPVQIQFQLGQPSAGGLRRGPVDGIFEFATLMEPGPDAPLEVRRLGKIVIHQYFEPAAVAKVLVQDLGGEQKSRLIVNPH